MKNLSKQVCGTQFKKKHFLKKCGVKLYYFCHSSFNLSYTTGVLSSSANSKHQQDQKTLFIKALVHFLISYGLMTWWGTMSTGAFITHKGLSIGEFATKKSWGRPKFKGINESFSNAGVLKSVWRN